VSFEYSSPRVEALPEYQQQITFLTRKIGDEEAARKMAELAVHLSEKLGYPYPVVTRTPNGVTIGVRWFKGTRALMAGYGEAVGTIEQGKPDANHAH
jgi:hypothetical protein